jgi:hypothetical protein
MIYCKPSDPRLACNVPPPPPAPDKCAEFSNRCPAHGTAPGTKSNTDNKNPKTYNPPAPTNQPVTYRPTPKPEPKRGPVVPWGHWCGTKCMIPGSGPLEEPQDDCRVGDPCWWLLPATVVTTGLFAVPPAIYAATDAVVTTAGVSILDMFAHDLDGVVADDPAPAPRSG